MKKSMLAGLVAVLGFAPAFALAQAQEKMLVGRCKALTKLELRLPSQTAPNY